MRHHRFFPILLASLLGTVTAAHAAGNEAALKADAVSLVKQFAGQLKPRLKQAMQEGVNRPGISGGSFVESGRNGRLLLLAIVRHFKFHRRDIADRFE